MRASTSTVATGAALVIAGLLAGTTPAAAATVPGEVLTFGGDTFGQLGNGAAGAHSTPGPAVLSGASDVAGGREHVLALVGTQVFAWGSDRQGQVGNGAPLANVASPVAVLSGAAAVTTGHYHSMALMIDGTVRAWGWDNRGQIGPAGAAATTVAAPVAVTGLPAGVIAVAAGRAHSLALALDGTVWSWGDNSFGQLGYGTADVLRHATPTPVQGLPGGIVAVAGGRDTSFAITASGDLWAWGNSQYGQVGNGAVGKNTDGTPRTVLAPVLVMGGIRQVESGADHTVAVTTTDQVWSWGRNRYGQLGYAGTASRSRPVRVTAVPAVSSVVAGRDHVLALATNGDVYTWGRNDGGQLGLDPVTVPSSSTPRLISALAGARDAGGGQVYSVVLG